MTPLEQLGAGIVSSNWELVKQAYLAMLGATQSSKSHIVQTVNPVQTGAKILFNGQEVVKPVQSQRAKPLVQASEFAMQRDHTKVNRKHITEDGKEVTLTRSEPIDVNKIRTVGTMFSDDKSIATEDLGLTKKLQVKTPTPREREGYNDSLVQVECTECGKYFEVNPAYLTADRYVCDNCITRKKNQHGR